MNVLLEGIFFNGHGLAEGNRILLRMLTKAGFRVRIVPRDAAEKNTMLDHREIEFISSFENTALSSNDIYLYNWVGSYVRYNPDFRVNIARTTFETDRIPDCWVPELNKFNEVWVQSRFNRDTFLSSGIEVPIKLIPNFFDTNLFSPNGPKLHLPVTETFLFLSVFDLKKRKGYDVLLDGFLSEFSPQDDVALVIKLRDNNREGKIESYIEAHAKPGSKRPAVYIIDQMMAPDELIALYRSCDAFVLPTRGEGWGRPFFEAMLMEMPAIGTNWSGHTDFMNDRNSFLVKVDRLAEITENENPMFNGHLWAEPSVTDLRLKMRQVVRNRKEAKRMAKKSRLELLQHYGMNATAEKVIRELYKYSGVLA